MYWCSAVAGGNSNGVYTLIGMIIIGIIIYVVVTEVSKPKTKVVEIVRDENGRIVQVVEFYR